MGGKARWRKLQRVVGCLPQGPHAALDKHKQRRERAKTRDAKRWRLGDDAEEEEANTILIGKTKERKKEGERKEGGRREVEELDAVPIGKTNERRKEEERKEMEELVTGTSKESKMEQERKEMKKLDTVLIESSKESKKEGEREEVKETGTIMSRKSQDKRKEDEREEKEREEAEESNTVAIETSVESKKEERKDRGEPDALTEKTKDEKRGEDRRKMGESITKIRREKEEEGEEKRKEHEADSVNPGKTKKMKTGNESRNEEETDTVIKGISKERKEDDRRKEREDSSMIGKAQEKEMEENIGYQEREEDSDILLCKETLKRKEEEEKQKAWMGKSKDDEKKENSQQHQQEREAKEEEEEAEGMKDEEDRVVQKVEKKKDEKGEEEEEEEEAEEIHPSEQEQKTVSEAVENRAGVWTPSLAGWVFRPYGDTTLEEELRKAQEEEDENGKKDQRHDNGQLAAKFFLSDDESDSDTAIFVDVSQPTLMEEQDLQPSVASCSSSLPHRETRPDEVLGTPSELPTQPTVETTQENEDVELVLADAIEEDDASETVDPLATVSTMEAVMTDCQHYRPPQFDFPFQFFQAETPPSIMTVDPPTESAKVNYVNTLSLSFSKTDEDTTRESTEGRTNNEESVSESMATMGAEEEDATKHKVYVEVEPELFSTPSASTPREEAPPAMNCNIGTEDPPWSDSEQLQDAQDTRYSCDSEAETRFFSLYPEYHPNEREEKSRDAGNEVIAYGNPKFPCFSGSCDSGEAAEEEVYMAAQEGAVKDGVRRHKGKVSKTHHRLAPQQKSEQETQNVTGVKKSHTEGEVVESDNIRLPCDASGGTSVPIVHDSSTSHLLETESTLPPYGGQHNPGHHAESTESQLAEEEKDGAEAGQDALELEGRVEVEQSKQTLVGKARQWIKGVTRMGSTRRDDPSQGKPTIVEATEGTYKKEEGVEFLRVISNAEATSDYGQAALTPGKELRAHYTPERGQEVCLTSAEHVRDIKSGEDSGVCQVNLGDSSSHSSLMGDSKGRSHPEDLQGDVASVEDSGKDPIQDKDTKHYAKPSENVQYEDNDDKDFRQSERVEDLKKHCTADEEVNSYAEEKSGYESNSDSSPYTKTRYSKDGEKSNQDPVPLAEYTDHSPLGENMMYDFAPVQDVNDHPTPVQDMEEHAVYDGDMDIHSIPITKENCFSFPDAPVFSSRPPLENPQGCHVEGTEHQEIQPKPARSPSFYEGSKLYYTPEEELNSQYTPVEGLKIFCQSGDAIHAHYKPEKDSRTRETVGKESITNMPATDFSTDYTPDDEEFKAQKQLVHPTCESTATHYTIIEEYIVSYNPAGEQCTYISTEEERMKYISTNEEKQRQRDPAEEQQKVSAKPQEDQKSHYTCEEKIESHSTPGGPQTSHSTSERDKIIISSPIEEQRDSATSEEDRKCKSPTAHEELAHLTPKVEPQMYTPAQKQQYDPILAKEADVYSKPTDEELICHRPAEETYTLAEAQKSHLTYKKPPDSDEFSPTHEWKSHCTTADHTYCDRPAEDRKTSTLDKNTPELPHYISAEEVKIQDTPGADLRIYCSPEGQLETCPTAVEDLETHSTPSKNDEENKDKEKEEMTKEGKVEAEMRMDDEGKSLNKKERKNNSNRRRRKESEREERRDSEREESIDSEGRERKDSSGEGRQIREREGRKDSCREKRDTGKEARRGSETEGVVENYIQGRRNSDRKERKDSEREEGWDESRENEKSSNSGGKKDGEREETNREKDEMKEGNGGERKEGGRQERRSSDYERNRENSSERKRGSEERRHSNYEGRRNNSGKGKKKGMEERREEEEDRRNKEEEKESGEEIKTKGGPEAKEWSERKGRTEEKLKGERSNGMEERNGDPEETRNSEMEEERKRERKGPKEKGVEGRKEKEATGSLDDRQSVQMASSTLVLSHQHAEGNEAGDTHCSLLGVSLTSRDQTTANPSHFNVSAAKEGVSGATVREDPLVMTTPETCTPQTVQMEYAEEGVMGGSMKNNREIKSRQKQSRTKQQPTSLAAVDNSGNAAADGNNPQDAMREGKSGGKRRRNRRNKGGNQGEHEAFFPASPDTRRSWTVSKAAGAESSWSVEDPLEGDSRNPSEVFHSQRQQELRSPRQGLDGSGSSAKLTVAHKDDATADAKPCKMWDKNPLNPKKQQGRYKEKFPDSQKCTRESRPRISKLSEEQKAAGAGEYAVSGSFGVSSGKETQEVERKGRKERGKGSERNEEEREVTFQGKSTPGGAQEGGVAKQSKNWSPKVERRDRKEKRDKKVLEKSEETAKEMEIKSPREELGGVAQRGGSGASKRRPPLLETPPMEPYSYITQKRNVTGGGYASPGSVLGAEPLPGPSRTTAKLRYPEALLQPLSPPPSPPPHKARENKSKGKARATLHETESNKEISIHADPSFCARKTSQSIMYTIPEASPARTPENPESELVSNRPQGPPKSVHLKDTSEGPSSDPPKHSWPAYPQDKQMSDTPCSTSSPQPSPHTIQSTSPPHASTSSPSIGKEPLREQQKSLSRPSAPLQPTPQQQQHQTQQHHHHQQQQQQQQQQKESVDFHRDTPNTKPPLKPKPSLAELDPLQRTNVTTETERDGDAPLGNSKALGDEEAKPLSSASKVSVAQRMKFPEAPPAALEADPDSNKRSQASDKSELLEARSTPAGRLPTASREGITAVPSEPLKTAEASPHSPSFTAPGSSPHTERSEPSPLRKSEGPVQKTASSPRLQRSNTDKPFASDFPKDAKSGGRYADVATKGRNKGGFQEPQTSSPVEADQGTSSTSASERQTQEGQSFDPPKGGTLPGSREVAKGMKKKKRR